LPSFNLYRGALLVMLVGTAVAVFLLVRPPGETRGSSPVFVSQAQRTATASTSDVRETPTAETPEATTPEATTTPQQSVTPEASAAPTEGPFIEYTVQEGDSLFSIAEAHQPANATITEYMLAIATLNGFTVENPILPVESILLLPRPPE
jgi:Tfp pilus assembly protein FimV